MALSCFIALWKHTCWPIKNARTIQIILKTILNYCFSLLSCGCCAEKFGICVKQQSFNFFQLASQTHKWYKQRDIFSQFCVDSSKVDEFIEICQNFPNILCYNYTYVWTNWIGKPQPTCEAWDQQFLAHYKSPSRQISTHMRSPRSTNLNPNAKPWINKTQHTWANLDQQISTHMCNPGSTNLNTHVQPWINKSQPICAALYQQISTDMRSPVSNRV